MRDVSDPHKSRGWSQPFRIHLSLVIAILLICVALPMVWLTYRQGSDSAVQAADVKMRLLSEQVIQRYRAVYGQGLTAINLAAATDTFLDQAPASLYAKVDFLSRRCPDLLTSMVCMLATPRVPLSTPSS